ncbi:MAG: hypothetical protein RLZZ141_502, partial [Pseudomonadota bacterium]
AMTQILIADLSMSLDNVLAVAGAARDHPVVLALGLLLSIALMGVAATWIAYVALHMIWDGHRKVVHDLNWQAGYNQIMPGPMDMPEIKP